MRSWLGRQIRRVGYWLVRFGDAVEGGESFVIPIDLEPEHALKALQDAEAAHGRKRPACDEGRQA